MLELTRAPERGVLVVTCSPVLEPALTFAIANYIEHQYQDVAVLLKALRRISHHPRQAREAVAKATGFPP